MKIDLNFNIFKKINKSSNKSKGKKSVISKLADTFKGKTY